MDKIHKLLDMWFGDLGHADLPTSDRTNLWFGDNVQLKEEIFDHFTPEFQEAYDGRLENWLTIPRGRLAVIILLDQFSRIRYKDSPKAFAQDPRAQQICLEGIEDETDRSLTLIERVFFYMPLVHSENLELQEKSIKMFQTLVSLSLLETRQVYQLFLAYSFAHFRVIKEFGRFPQRNQILGRESTDLELAFLKNT